MTHPGVARAKGVEGVRWAGAGLVLLALAFNLPYARLAATFDYPGILRQPAEAILAAFAAGGPGLVATWYVFALCALLFVPVGMAHALAGGRAVRFPALAVAAAVAAALAGVTQAMGLLRWVMVVPDLARRGDAEGFALIHAFGGVAVGEHLGMLLTALHVGLVAAMQRAEGGRAMPALGLATAAGVAAGATEGVLMATGLNGGAAGLAAVAGYLALTLWMLAAGAIWLRGGVSPGR